MFYTKNKTMTKSHGRKQRIHNHYLGHESRSTISRRIEHVTLAADCNPASYNAVTPFCSVRDLHSQCTQKSSVATDFFACSRARFPSKKSQKCFIFGHFAHSSNPQRKHFVQTKKNEHPRHIEQQKTKVEKIIKKNDQNEKKKLRRRIRLEKFINRKTTKKKKTKNERMNQTSGKTRRDAKNFQQKQRTFGRTIKTNFLFSLFSFSHFKKLGDKKMTRFFKIPRTKEKMVDGD